MYFRIVDIVTATEMGVYEAANKTEAMDRLASDVARHGEAALAAHMRFRYELACERACDGCVDRGTTPDKMGAVESFHQDRAYCRPCYQASGRVVALSLKERVR